MTVAEVEQGAGLHDGQINGRTLGDRVEVHVSAGPRRVSGRDRRRAEPRRHGHAAQHGPERNGEFPERFGGVSQSGDACLPIQIPAHAPSQSGGLSGDGGGLGASDHAVQAVGIVAVEGQATDPHGQHVARPRPDHIEGARLGIAEQGARDPLAVHAAGIERGRPEGIARPDEQRRLQILGKQIRPARRGEYVGLDLRRGAFGKALGREAVPGAPFGVIGVGLVGEARQALVVGLAFELIEGAVLVGGGEADPAVGLHAAFEAVAVEVSAQALAGAVQGQGLVDRIAPQVGRHPPGSILGRGRARPAHPGQD